MSNIPLFPGRKRSKSKMKQKRFEHKNTSNRKLPLVLLDAQGTIGKNKFSSSKLSRRTSLVQRTHSPIFFNVSTPPTPVLVPSLISFDFVMLDASSSLVELDKLAFFDRPMTWFDGLLYF